MEDINKQINHSKLLVGKVFDSLTNEQKEVFQEWEQQGNNKEIADDILNAYSFMEWQEKLKAIDTTEEWASFLENMESASEKPGKVLRLKTIKRMSAAAAVLVVGFAVFTFFKITNSNLKSVEDSSIAPGTTHAELVLSTGEVVDLQQSQDSKMQEGTVALENVKGVLQYNTGSSKHDGNVKTNTLKVPRGGEYQIVLSDGTKVWLNSDTELTYTVPFVGSERRVALEGEAYFDVTPNKELPFIVTSGTQEVQVLGTEFNVSAYTEDNHIITTLVEGKVKVEEKYSHSNEFLSPNQQANFDINTKSIVKKDVDVYPYVAWKEGRFVFHNVTLEELFSKISKWYNVDYQIEGEKLKVLKFTGDLPRYNDMSGILKIIEAEMSVNIQIGHNNKVYVSE
ncbi:FecR domain-containing protein [Aestuariibaculum sp. YM273]|uniref:FecR family protein n=1 Tax=Aestuariibaculum sp. YM273 TaxID=3070659 RepID=UPI0027DAEC25|nr:FecR family protein [Aestuariibaculum sp. YM273]WMI66025.1 FecR domain-containing protein [Aestuariibaculum sp. YM273]